MRYRSLVDYKYDTLDEYVRDVPEMGFWDITTDFILLKDGIIYITAHYAWDGASGPTIDRPCNMMPSLVHDAFYQLIRKKELPSSARKTADRVMKRMLVEDGMNPLVANIWYLGLRLFAGYAAKPKKEKQRIFTIGDSNG